MEVNSLALLVNKTQNQNLLADLQIANNFLIRAQGLIGTRSLSEQKGIWFPHTNWIHTFFMSIPIDVIYLDKKMHVNKLQPNLKPWRMPLPALKSSSVVEVQAGFIKNKGIRIGDQLHVGD